MAEPIVNEKAEETPSPSQDELMEAVLDGLESERVGAYLISEEEKTSPEPAPPKADQEAELATLRTELAEERQKRKTDRDAQKNNWTQENLAKVQAQEYATALEQSRLRQQQIEKLAADLEPPSIEDVDWDDALADGNALNRAVTGAAQKFAEWGFNKAMAAMSPMMQNYQAASQQWDAVIDAAADNLIERGARLLKSKYGVADFDDYRGRIKEGFMGQGSEGLKLMKDEMNIVRSYGMLAMEEGKGFSPAGGDSSEPVHSSSAPKFDRGAAETLPPRVNALWRKMAPTLGADPNKPPTLAEMREMGIDI